MVKKKMKTYKNLLYILFVLFFVSCNFENNKTKTSVEETEYLPNIAWTLQTDALWSQWQITKDNFLYFEEYTGKDDIYQYSKVNLKTGEYVWKSDTYNVSSLFESAINDKYLCCFDGEGKLSFFDINTGKRAALILVGNNEEEIEDYRLHGNNLTFYKHYLYWSNNSTFGKSKEGLVRIDIDSIDFSKNDIPQIIIPNCLWETSTQRMVNSFVVDNDIMFFLTVNDQINNNSGFAYLIAWDLINDKEIWSSSLEDISAYSYNSVKLVDDRIFIFDDGIYVCDKNTGKILYKKIQTREDLMHEINISAPNYLAGIYYEDGLFYYTRVSYPGSNETMGFPEEYNRNIICYDGNKYKIAWSDMPPYKEGGSLMTRPVVVNGKCFVVTSSGLRVYEAKSGKFLGVWRDIYNFGWDYNASYEDKFIFFNHDRETGKGILTAITVE